MLVMEEVWEIHREDTNKQGLPPGYRFHPTDEELVTFYLASKVLNNGSFSSSSCGVDIAEIDLNRCEPWELPDRGKIAGEKEWYFFSCKDRKYPTGLRTNRATEAGYWKATGKDKQVQMISNDGSGCLVGMKKTLVFYKGRAPKGEKTKWVMHEYRLVGHLSSLRTSKEEWVISRIHHKAGGGCGEKTRSSPLMSDQFKDYPFEPLPPLMDSPAAAAAALVEPLMNPPPHFLIRHENDLIKTSTLVNNNNDSLSQPLSLFSKGLLSSHLDYYPYEQTSANHSSIFQQAYDGNYMKWVDKIQQNSLFLEMNGCGGGWGLVSPYAAASTAETCHELSTLSSVAFNRPGFQMMIDSHISGHGQSGCLDA